MITIRFCIPMAARARERKNVWERKLTIAVQFTISIQFRTFHQLWTARLHITTPIHSIWVNFHEQIAHRLFIEAVSHTLPLPLGACIALKSHPSTWIRIKFQNSIKIQQRFVYANNEPHFLNEFLNCRSFFGCVSF